MNERYFKAESKKNWYSTKASQISNEQLMLGCAMRIADAVELMATRYTDLVDERNNYKRWYDEQSVRMNKSRRAIAALQGHLRRSKK